MFDEFLEDYKYRWKMADKKYMEECYRKSLSPKQIEKAKNSQMISIFLKIKWMWENLKNSIEAARFPEILALAIAVFQIGKNLSEALNYYANSLYKGSSLIII